YLTESNNYDVLVPWLTLALKSGDHAVLPRVERAVGEVGRMKYLRPLYTALATDPQLRARGEALYAKHAAGYHPIARQMVEGVQARYRATP
ncbi:MAG TPA: leukotriene A4 hydrolase C-terminal domain-containing protein, partial [Kofleriaceae bacterium]